MLYFIQYLLIILFTVYVFTKSLAYGLYEIKSQNNKYGGISVIVFSFIVCICILIFILI